MFRSLKKSAQQKVICLILDLDAQYPVQRKYKNNDIVYSNDVRNPPRIPYSLTFGIK